MATIEWLNCNDKHVAAKYATSHKPSESPGTATKTNFVFKRWHFFYDGESQGNLGLVDCGYGFNFIWGLFNKA
jgi:hypothetical protein